jgi:hypothetical protein
MGHVNTNKIIRAARDNNKILLEKLLPKDIYRKISALSAETTSSGEMHRFVQVSRSAAELFQRARTLK